MRRTSLGGEFTTTSVRVAKTNTAAYARYELKEAIHVIGIIEPYTWESLDGEQRAMRGC